MSSIRQQAVESRLAVHSAGVIPQRGHVLERLDLFVRMVEAAAATIERVATVLEIAPAVAALLRRHQFPAELRIGGDPRLTLAWAAAGLCVQTGAAGRNDLVAVSHAFTAVAETGTLILVSGADNPTTLNFLPDLHVVVVGAADILPDFETAMARLRERFGTGRLPRNVNFITGPSRSADIEQTLILGAHGPRQLHVVVVDEAGNRPSRRGEHAEEGKDLYGS